MAASSRFHRSSFFTGLLSAVFQPRCFHRGSHLVMPSCRYMLSVWMTISTGRFSDSSAAIAAISSMRLLVVWAAPPQSSFSTPL